MILNRRFNDIVSHLSAHIDWNARRRDQWTGLSYLPG